MGYPKTLEKDATYQCSHTLHLTKTVHNEDEEECFVCWMYDHELCPECRAANAIRYREVYETIENPRHNGYVILFKRFSPVWTGSMLFEEKLWNDCGNLRTTRLLVENDINGGELVPVGLYRRLELLETADYIPFDGYTVEYMKFLLRHDREAIQAERDLLEANRKATVGWGV